MAARPSGARGQTGPGTGQDDSIFGDKVKGSTLKPKPKPPASEDAGESTDVPTPAAKPAPVRQPIPNTAAAAAAEKTVKEAYEAEFAGQKPQDRVALATKLIDASREEGVTPAERYVLLREAANAAAGAGDAKLAVRAADAIAKDFLIRAADFKSTLLQNAAKGPLARDPAAAAALARAAMDVADEEVLSADYEGAFKLAAVAEGAARNAKDDALNAEVTPRVTEVRRLRAEFTKLGPSLEKLRTDPADAAGNLKVGRFYCLTAGDWTRGLPYLQKGGDATLQSLANQELSPPADANARIAIADGWWELAKREPGPAGEKAKRHAQTWYRAAEKDVKGVMLAKVRQRLETPAETVAAAPPTSTAGPAAGGGTAGGGAGATATARPAGKPVSLLKGVKTSRDAVAGQWGFVADGLQSDFANNSRLQFAGDVPAEYDLYVDFTIVKGYGVLTAILPKPTGTGHMCFGMFGTMFGLQSTGSVEGPTMKRILKPLHFGDRVNMTIKVRKEKVTGLVGNEVLFDVKTDYSDVYGYTTWKLADPKLAGVGTDQTVVVFHKVTLKDMTGVAETPKK